MAKIVDITEKLNFEQKPIIKIKDEELTVNNEATAIIKIMPLFDGEMTASAVYEIFNTLFSEEDCKKITGLQLDFKDLSTLVMTAVSLVAGEAQPGEAQIPATT